MIVTLVNYISTPPRSLEPLHPFRATLRMHVCVALVWHLVGLSLDAFTADHHLWWQTPMHNSVWHSWDP